MNKKATDKQTCVQWLLDQWQMKNSHECPSFCQHMHLHVNSLHIYAGWYVRIVNFEWCYCRLDYRKRIPFPIEWYFLNKFHARRAHTVPKCNWNFFSRKKKRDSEWAKGVCGMECVKSENESAIQLLLTTQKTCHFYMWCIKIVLRRIVMQAAK